MRFYLIFTLSLIIIGCEIKETADRELTNFKKDVDSRLTGGQKFVTGFYNSAKDFTPKLVKDTLDLDDDDTAQSNRDTIKELRSEISDLQGQSEIDASEIQKLLDMITELERKLALTQLDINNLKRYVTYLRSKYSNLEHKFHYLLRRIANLERSQQLRDRLIRANRLLINRLFALIRNLDNRDYSNEIYRLWQYLNEIEHNVTINQTTINNLVNQVNTIINKYGDVDNSLTQILNTINNINIIVNEHNHDDDNEDDDPDNNCKYDDPDKCEDKRRKEAEKAEKKRQREEEKRLKEEEKAARKQNK